VFTPRESLPARTLAWLAADRKRRYWMLVLFVAALLVRLHWNLHVHLLQDHLRSDMRGYWIRADQLLDHPFARDEYDAFFPFGTTWLIAAIKAVFGRYAFTATAVVYALLGASVVAVSYAIADRVIGARSRWVAPAVGLLLMVYYPLIAMGGYILSELPFCCCLMISVLLLIRLLDDGRPCDAWLLGLMLGLGALFRPQLLLSIALVGLLWLLMKIAAWRGKADPYARLNVAMLARVAVPLALILTMASIRFHAHTGQFGLVSANSSINLVFGRCHNKGMYARPDGAGHTQNIRFSPPPLIQFEKYSAQHPDALIRIRSVWADHPEPVEGVPGFAVDAFGCKKRKCYEPGSEIEYRGYIGDKAIHHQLVRACIERGGIERQAYFTLTHWILLWRYNLMWPDQANPLPHSTVERETWRARQIVWARIHRALLMVPALLGLAFVFVPRRRPTEALLAINLLALLIMAGVWFGDMRLRAPYDPLVALLAGLIYAEVVSRLRRRFVAGNTR
jgi:4-amino-4-deoxy-L-arabinose transferase-like glycosyltransferase